MRRVLPRSLLGQMLLAVAIALLVAQTISAVLLYRAQEQRREFGVLNGAAFSLAVDVRNPDSEAETLRERRADLVYVCNPDTPTGTMLPPERIRSFCEAASETCPVFLDEVYLELLEDFRSQTQVGLVREGFPVVIGRSFSKMHGLAGHRVGYAIGPAELLKQMGELKMSSLGYLGVIAALASVGDDAFHRQSVRLITQGRERFCGLLDELGLKYTPSFGNFVFHHTGREIRAFQATMKERGFLVGRPFPPYDDWCRISIGNPQEMAKYEQAMREVFA